MERMRVAERLEENEASLLNHRIALGTQPMAKSTAQ